MSDFERRFIGNIRESYIWEDNSSDGCGVPLAIQWFLQGIKYETSDPVPSKTYTIEDLRAMGFVGVTLVIPKPEQVE